MNTIELIEESSRVLSSFRMISVKNMAIRLNKNLNEIVPLLDTLQKSDAIRIVRPKTCSSSCNSCSGCTFDSTMQYSGNEIIISLICRKGEIDVDE